MERREHIRQRVVHGFAHVGGELQAGVVFDDAPVDEVHDVEGGAEDVRVLAEQQDAGDGDVGVLERLEHLVLPVHGVRALEEGARRLLAHDIPMPVGRGEQVRRVALPFVELRQGRGRVSHYEARVPAWYRGTVGAYLLDLLQRTGGEVAVRHEVVRELVDVDIQSHLRARAEVAHSAAERGGGGGGRRRERGQPGAAGAKSERRLARKAGVEAELLLIGRSTEKGAGTVSRR